MAATNPWASGQAYDAFMGRWSRLVATEFLDWIAIPPGRRWLDLGCGTGALTSAILARFEPAAVVGVDPSEGFLATARERVTDPRARFQLGQADATGLEAASLDVAVAGLVLNFVPDVRAALEELGRVVRAGGLVAGYVWDYGGEMQMLRRFWDAAIALDPAAAALNQGERFPLAAREPLLAAFVAAGLEETSVRPIDIPMRFRDFDDLWLPFLGGTGPAPTYVASLDEPDRAALRARYRAMCPPDADGSISLLARTWAARGRVPDPASTAERPRG